MGGAFKPAELAVNPAVIAPNKAVTNKLARPSTNQIRHRKE
jgi:hypothetical protein